MGTSSTIHLDPRRPGRDNDLRPHQQGTFKLSKDPRFAERTRVLGSTSAALIEATCAGGRIEDVPA